MIEEQAMEISQPGPEDRLGAALRRAREGRGVSLRALAKRLCRSHSSLVEYERGHRLAPLHIAQAYETELGMPSGTLVALHERARFQRYGEDRSHRQTYVLRPTADAPHQLPPGVANFTGREAELEALRALVADRHAGMTMVSVITGTAGVGKTALAVHLAHELVSEFPDVQLYADLRGYQPAQHLAPARVLDRFLRDLGVPSDALPADLDEQVVRYRGLLAGRRALVILDNASSAEQIRPLLPGEPNCLVLITSRDSLGGLVAAEGAHLLILDVLAAEEGLELLSRIAGPGRVNAELEEAGEVVRLCGYLPHAVRIAGARLAARPSMHLATLAERLADATGRLSELSIGDVEVRSSLALSYRALEPATACMFRRLGLVPGPDFTREVAAVVMETTSREAERSLDALVDAHLVENGSAEGRYRLAALLNLYARELARTEETEDDRRATLRRMLEWHLGRADAAEGLLIPGRRRLPYRRSGQWHEPAFASRADAAAWFEAERPGLVAATHQAAESELHAIAWQLPDALRSYLCLRSSWTDLRHTHHVGLFAARKAGNRQAEAWMMTSLGQTYCELHQFDEAIDLCLGSLALYRAIGDREGEARALCGLGNSYMEVRRLAEAVQCHQQALAISQQSRYLYREASVWRHLGVAYGALRRFDEAIGCLRRALSIHRELGDRWHEGDALLHLAQVYGDRQRFKESVRYVQRALAIHREVGYRWGEARALELLGLALQHSQGKEAAHVRWREALAIFLQLGAPQVDEVRALMGVPESPPGRSLRLCPQPVRSHS